MKSKFISLVLGTVLAIGGLFMNISMVKAASAWNGTHDGMSFDYHDNN